MKTVTLEYLPGNGQIYLVNVAYITDQGAVDAYGLCAFCHGDPCAEETDNPNSVTIIKYYFDCVAGGLLKVETCPMCQGRPS